MLARAANREPEMGERSEPKQVCRRNALAFLGYAAVFGLVASPAILTASQAKPKPPRRPPRPRRRPQMRRSQVRSGVRNGEAGEQNDVRNDARDAQSGVRSGAQDATSDGTRATAPPPSKKSNRSIRADNGTGPPSARARQRKGQNRPASRTAATPYRRISGQKLAGTQPGHETTAFSTTY